MRLPLEKQSEIFSFLPGISTTLTCQYQLAAAQAAQKRELKAGENIVFETNNNINSNRNGNN